ncbi:MAG: ASCH domain-containing protein [Desulfurococcales archaeon]|nr:ASCH domain-containing protein [Desulfurococcales archaeon]
MVRRKKLFFKKEFAVGIASGSKTSTIRLSSNLRAGDEVELIAGGIRLGMARIESVEVKKVRELTDDDARRDGFSSRDELVETLKRLYRSKGLNEGTEVKLIRFKLKRQNQ